MTLQSDLVGTSHWTWAARGIARMMSEDFPEYDDAVGVHPYTNPGEWQPTKLGAAFARAGGVTVVDDGDLDRFVAGMGRAPGLLIAFEGVPEILPTNPDLQTSFPMVFRLTLKTDPKHDDDPTVMARADIVNAITARLYADRYELGRGRIPWPAEIEPWDGPGNPPPTRCLSHGIIRATSVGPPSRLPGEGDLLRDDIEVIFSSNVRLAGSGRWVIQE